MLLTGTYPRTLDEKLRFSIPKELREGGGRERQVFYVTPGTDGSLCIYGEDVLNRLANRLNAASPAAESVRAYRRLFYAQAQRVELDSQARIRLPMSLADGAGLTKDIVVLGVQDHIEVWDRTRWEHYLQGNRPQYDGLAERAFAGGGREPTENRT